MQFLDFSVMFLKIMEGTERVFFNTAFPGHKQGAGWEAVLSGLEPVPIWDPSAFKARTLASRPLYWALNFIYLFF